MDASSRQPYDPASSGLFRINPDRETELKHMLRVLWRRRLLLIACVVLAAGSVWAVTAQMTPIFSATAAVMLETRRSRVIDLKDVLSQATPHFLTINTEVEVVRSRTIAQRVADTLDLYNDPDFNPSLRPAAETSDLLRSLTALWTELLATLSDEPEAGPVDEERRQKAMRAGVVSRVIGSMSAEAVPQSLAIRIGFRSPDPEKAARIANAIADAYVVEQLETKFEAVRRATTWLNTRLEGLRRAVEVSENQVVAYRSQMGLVDERGRQGASQTLAEMNSQLVIVRSKRTEIEAMLNRTETLQNNRRGADLLDEFVDSPLLQHLKQLDVQLSREASDLASRYGDRHPQMLKVRAELAQTRTKIQLEIERHVEGMRGERAVLREREAALISQIRQIENAAIEQSGVEIRLRELEREAQANRAIFEAFLSRFKETGEQEQIQQADVRVLSWAEPPGAPSSPRTRLLVTGAVLFGLIGGAVLVLVLEQLDNTFRSRKQLEDSTGLPTLGLIPAIRPKGGQRAVEGHIMESPASSFAESLRIVWFALKHSLPERESSVIVVTSSVPEEGKSLTALSLARTAANLSLRVVLVDADLRRASIAQTLNLTVPDGKGIVDVLAGRIGMNDAIVKDPRSKLDVLSGAPVKSPQFEYGLLSAENFEPLVTRLRAEYDLVVIDSPPTLPVADVQMLVQYADRVVFCVRWDKTPKENVVSALRMLQDVNARIGGLLLTRVNVRKHARYGYGDLGHYYGSYHGYYTE